jgi:hypothetical protein
MSWMRCGWPLYHFDAESTEYVWSDGESVTDYGSPYRDNCSFVQLIHNMVERETGDEEYADKILVVLAEKLGVADKLRRAPDGSLLKMTYEEYDELCDRRLEKHLQEERRAKSRLGDGEQLIAGKGGHHE